MLTVWLPLLLLPVCSAIAAVLVGVVFGLVAPIGLIFSDDWTPWAHVTTTCHMVVDYNRVWRPVRVGFVLAVRVR